MNYKVIIGSILIFFILISCESITLESFLQQELTPFPNDYIKVDPDQVTPNSREKAFQYYDQQSYREAQAFFVSHEVRSYEDQNINFFLANAYLGQQLYDKAFETLENLSFSSKYYYHSIWYKALLLAKQAKLTEASALIDNYLLLSDYSNFKMKEAKQLQALLKLELNQDIK